MAASGEHRSSRLERLAERKLTGPRLRPRDAAYLIAGIWTAGVILFGVIERIADPDTFPSVWLAFWWAIQTVTTVGYGDIVPSQTSGKVLAAVLMLGGLAFLSIVTASITSAFVARRQAEIQAAGEDPVIRELADISARLERIETRLGSK
jgi:voltage-gated potassium channel